MGSTAMTAIGPDLTPHYLHEQQMIRIMMPDTTDAYHAIQGIP